MVHKKQKNFMNVVSIMPWQKTSWIMNSSIYGEERTQITLISPTAIDDLLQNLGEAGPIPI